MVGTRLSKPRGPIDFISLTFSPLSLESSRLLPRLASPSVDADASSSVSFSFTKLVIGKNLTGKKTDKLGREAQFRESQAHREHVHNWSSIDPTLSSLAINAEQ